MSGTRCSLARRPTPYTPTSRWVRTRSSSNTSTTTTAPLPSSHGTTLQREANRRRTRRVPADLRVLCGSLDPREAGDPAEAYLSAQHADRQADQELRLAEMISSRDTRRR